MNDMKIYFPHDTEDQDRELVDGGRCSVVYVRIDNQFFRFKAYTLAEFDSVMTARLERYGYYKPVEAYIVFVKELNKQEIMATIQYRYEYVMKFSHHGENFGLDAQEIHDLWVREKDDFFRV